MKRKLLIISQEQFGYLIDTFYYCKYLKDDFDITYICWDFGKERVGLDSIKTVYVARGGNFIARSFRFVQIARQNIKYETIVFIKYFKFISTVLKISKPKNKFVLDIRSGSVEDKWSRRLYYDLLMKMEAKFFKNITVISKSLRKKIGFNSTSHILPLGADVISSNIKNFRQINLLYVGTLYNRKIEDTVVGFSRFYKEFKEKIPITYTIIGTGRSNEVEWLSSIVEKENLQEVVFVLGEIPHHKLKEYFDYCNVGVSYVPITDYFNCQPPTKTFEYLLSGMPVIATQTDENRAVINSTNGVLIEDNPDSFFHGLVEWYIHRNRFNSESIQTQSMRYGWATITQNLKNYLFSL